MDKIIFSYSLFEPKQLFHENRAHDKHNHQLRYWYNLPLIPIVNKILYPNSETLLYVDQSIWKNPISEVIKILLTQVDTFKVVLKKDSYNTIEPTFWRFEPIFDKGNTAVFTRDIDSLPSKEEFYLTNYFLATPWAYVQTIRSHPNHIFPITKMLAGLSGFKPNKIESIKETSFQKFCETYLSEVYGSDQKALIDFFTKDKGFTLNHFLDCRINTQKKLPKPLIDCKELVFEKKLEKKMYDVHFNELLSWLQKNIAWSGEPIDIRGLPINDFLQLSYPEVKLLINSLSLSSMKVRDFYLFK
jgi:hypothetical protein